MIWISSGGSCLVELIERDLGAFNSAALPIGGADSLTLRHVVREAHRLLFG